MRHFALRTQGKSNAEPDGIANYAEGFIVTGSDAWKSKTNIKTVSIMVFDFNSERTLDTLTIGEFSELMRQCLDGNKPSVESGSAPTGRLVYGIKGIEELFGVSHKTAQRLKDHDIKQAVVQNGRMIVVDVDKAMRLFNKKRAK